MFSRGCQLACRIFLLKSMLSVSTRGFFGPAPAAPLPPFLPAAPLAAAPGPPLAAPLPPSFLALKADLSAWRTMSCVPAVS